MAWSIQLLFLSSVPECLGAVFVRQDLPNPTPTRTFPDVVAPDFRVGAIIPTAPGQIGINPVDYQPDATVGPEFTTNVLTVTVGTGPSATVVVAPALVTATVVGTDLNIYFAPSILGKFAAYAEAAPLCGAKRQELCELQSLLHAVESDVEMEKLEAQLTDQVLKALGKVAEGARNLIEYLGAEELKKVLAIYGPSGAKFAAIFGVIQITPILYNEWRQSQENFAATFRGVSFETKDIKVTKPQEAGGQQGGGQQGGGQEGGNKKDCPNDQIQWPACDAENCKAAVGSLLCTTGEFATCPCKQRASLGADEQVQRRPIGWDGLFKTIMVYEPPTFGQEQVKNVTCASSQRYDYKIETWAKLASAFCGGRSMRENQNATFESVYQFGFTWTPNEAAKAGTCNYECQDMFYYFMSDPSLGCTIGFPNTIAGGGRQENDCGVATWSMGIPNANIIIPDPGPVPVGPGSSPECDLNGIISKFPENLFRAGLTDKFCAERDKNPSAPLAWTVDAGGNKITPPAYFRQLRRRGPNSKSDTREIEERAPPPNPNSYPEHSFQLKWRPEPPFNGCDLGCHDTMMQIANSPCGHNGGNGNTMIQDITWDVGCGTFDVHINMPKAKERECNGPEPLGVHGTVKMSEVDAGAEWFCNSLLQPQDELGAGEEPIVHVFSPNIENPGGTPFDLPPAAIGLISSFLRFEVKWVDDCRSYWGAPKVNLQNPLQYLPCRKLLFDNWDACKGNGGAGGHIQVGCLQYSFRPYDK